ncbi:MAG TPA: hypothetical protein PLV83_01555 [Bacilli bacterium]|nr:hypothetical protein [Bacilli bacterium]
MIINNKEFDVDQLVKDLNIDNSLLKNYGNGILLSDNDISILNMYNIDYKKFNDVKLLLFEIEEVLEECDDAKDLEALSIDLSERNYYQNTNK